MSVRTDIPELKRIQFFNGQRLSADDLAELQRANRELRWLHNRSLHGWGIGIGYGVEGERGDTSVTIAPGYALDCMGREIILTEPLTVTVPATAGRSESGTVVPAVFYLTVSYKADADQPVAERRAGVCVPAGTVRLDEGPLVAWREPQDITDGMDIILAQANVLNCQLDSTLALGVRRSARPSQQPYLASGETVAASTVWTVKIESGVQVGVTTRVDTSAARFQATPTYFAHVIGSRVVSTSVGQQIALTLIAVSQPAPAGFNCDVYLPSGEVPGGPLYLSAEEAAAVLNSLQWSVVWMGIEG
jgi:hypothetical protein